MSRVQLALNVPDLGRAVTFYSKLFGVEPGKVRPGYANFAVADPPLKLILIEDGTQPPGSLNHLGVEVESSQEVAEVHSRLDRAGLTTTAEDQVTCCFALQDKVWVDGPGGEAWEVYTVLADADKMTSEPCSVEPATASCCETRPDLAGIAHPTPR